MGKYFLEYVWLDANQKFRTKVKITSSLEITEWNYDGSSTGQAKGHNSEILLKPFKTIKSPFKNEDDKYYVFCESLTPDHKPALGNTRSKAVEYFKRDDVNLADPMFGIEQEFYVFKDGKPLVWSDNPAPQGDYYCGVGSDSVGSSRDFLEFLTDVLSVDVLNFNLTGTNLEVGPGQMEIQICEKGLDAADHLMMMRFFITLMAETDDYQISFEPKPEFLKGSEWNGSGCHVNFSTQKMRTENNKNPLQGVYEMANTLENLRENHSKDISKLGSANNQKRLTGENETSSYETFTYGVAHRGCSARIPRQSVKELKGYIEDRRPGSDMDPYVVLPLICEAGMTRSTKKEQVYEIMNDILGLHMREYMK